MADRRVGTKLPSQYTNDLAGVRLSAGPYIGIVKNNVDPAHRGRLQVFIPDLGGDEENHTHWRTVSYASPYWGSTQQIRQVTSNTFDTTSHSYGMWCVPPDIGNWVLVTFASSDPNQGFWFACVPRTASHYMVPAIGSSSSIEPGTNNGVTAPQYPVVEFNESNESISWDTINKVRKPVHREQFKTLVNQGLEADTVRGTITSSSQRETPSGVFGISTPGRPSKMATSKSAAAAQTPDEKTVNSRLGGHTFVMDDGDASGNDQLVRLRTAGGHQILMHDTEGTVYIANKDGMVWLELGPSGDVFLYAKNNINIRCENDLNIHADQDINFYAGSEIKLYAKTQVQMHSKDVNVRADNNMSLSAGNVGSYQAESELVYRGGMIYLNTKEAPSAPPIPVSSFPEAQPGATWTNVGQMLSSKDMAGPPTHEPYKRPRPTKSAPAQTTTPSSAPVSQATAAPEPAPPAPVMSGSYEDKATALIKNEEGLPKNGKAYWDPPGQTTKASIGYGHQITAQEVANNEIDLGNGEKVPLQGTNGIDTKLTPEQSDALLKKDLPKYTAAAKGPVGEEAWGKLNDDQKAVLTSYSYNTGSTRSLVKAGMRDEILAGNTEGAANIISTKGTKTSGGNYMSVLDARRQRESAIFSNTTIKT